MSIARSSRPLRSMTIGIKGIGKSLRSGSAAIAFSRGGPVDLNADRRNSPPPPSGMDRNGRVAGRRRPGARSAARRAALAGLGRGDVADDLVDEPVLLGLDGGQVAIALGVLGDALQRLAGVPGQDLVDDL